MELSISEQLMYSTVRIESLYPNGGIGTGTGFIFKFSKDEKLYIPVILTNKHVVSGANQLNFVLTEANEKGEPIDSQHITVSLKGFEQYIISHDEVGVDLCAILLAPILKQIENQNKRTFFIMLDKNVIPSSEQLSELSALEDIIMIGYPNGIWDKVNNKPIFRKGITATSPTFDYNGKKEFVIDAACFPGSSGSPVFLLNQGGYFGKNSSSNGSIFIGKSRLYLLGILYAGPQHTATGEIKVIDIPVINKPVVISTIPNNLGIIIKSERILELEEQLISALPS